ncbi:MAG TPA: class I SAM-dependent methyltransferase [Rhodocyclaceae bacterium]|jgi:ubiquinone/menaquinone biosynthesis C-methylase UbiE|nr:class I SAM-dependent methyltransferase [Rhodocyclaceae bacterium]
MTQEKPDVWMDWVLHHRHGGDTQFREHVRTEITQYADRVLDAAGLRPNMTLADIGTGDGLVGLRAIQRIGPSLKVVMTDISEKLLDHAKALATEQDVQTQCTFIQGSADALIGIADNSVDAVTCRAVLAYVADKPAAFREIHRVLRPGGYLSIAEPIMLDAAIEVITLRRIVAARKDGDNDPFIPMLLRWRAALYPDTEEKMCQLPITSFGERDFIRYAMDAGFTDIHLEFHIDVENAALRPSWNVYREMSPHPLAPTLSKVLDEHFTLDERQFFEDKLRVLYETNQQLNVDRIVWMTARKPLGT